MMKEDNGSLALGILLGLLLELFGVIIALILGKRKTVLGSLIGLFMCFVIVLTILLLDKFGLFETTKIVGCFLYNI